MTKEEFEELLLDYHKNSKKIIEKIKFLLKIKKIKDISNENFQELYDYINEITYKNRNIQNFQNKIRQIEEESSTYFSDSRDLNEESYYSMNSIITNNEIEDEDNNDSENKEENNDSQVFLGYINSINDLKNNIQPDDFLQLHEPLKIEGEYEFTDRKCLKELYSRNYKIHNLYYNVVKDLRKMEKLSYYKSGYLVCSDCFGEICEIKDDNLILTNSNIGEHKISFSWMNDNLKVVFDKNNQKEKNINYLESEKDKFVKNLNDFNIKYENLLTCNSGNHIVGYVRKGENYIYFGSKLSVEYPDLTFENIKDKECFMNDFKDIKNKIERIMEFKRKDEFKDQIFCKLCNFHVKNDLSEFKIHLISKDHQEKLKELRREFI